MPTHIIPMLSKKPRRGTTDLHQDILGTRNLGLGYLAKRTQPVLYDGNTLLDPTHTLVSVWDSDDVLVHQMELSREQAYWLNSKDHTPSKPVTPFVRKGPPPSQENYHFGDSCQYVHDANARVPNATSGFNKGLGTSDNSTNDLLNKLLAQLGKLGMNMLHTGTNVTLPNTIAPTISSSISPSQNSSVPITYYASLSPTAPTGPSTLPGFPMPAQVLLYYTAGLAQSVPAHASPTRLSRTHLTMLRTWIQDFMTRQFLLRCDSTRDLYPIMVSSPISHAFLRSLPFFAKLVSL
nr:hypothetical protein [Tanacetum cinerariifolium]